MIDAFRGVGQTAADAARSFEEVGRRLEASMPKATPSPPSARDLPTLRYWHRATCRPCQNEGEFAYDPMREEYTCPSCGVVVTAETLHNWEGGIVQRQEPGSRGPGIVTAVGERGDGWDARARLDACPHCFHRQMRREENGHHLCLSCSATFTPQQAEEALMESSLNFTATMTSYQGAEILTDVSEAVRAYRERERARDKEPARPEDLRTRRLRVKGGTR
jgi:ribosomal protein L37AE/L43A